MVKPKPPEPYRVAIPIPPALLAKVDDFRWKNRLPSRAHAIRALLEIALAANAKPKP